MFLKNIIKFIFKRLYKFSDSNKFLFSTKFGFKNGFCTTNAYFLAYS